MARRAGLKRNVVSIRAVPSRTPFSPLRFATRWGLAFVWPACMILVLPSSSRLTIHTWSLARILRLYGLRGGHRRFHCGNFAHANGALLRLKRADVIGKFLTTSLLCLGGGFFCHAAFTGSQIALQRLNKRRSLRDRRSRPFHGLIFLLCKRFCKGSTASCFLQLALILGRSAER